MDSSEQATEATEAAGGPQQSTSAARPPARSCSVCGAAKPGPTASYSWRLHPETHETICVPCLKQLSKAAAAQPAADGDAARPAAQAAEEAAAAALQQLPKEVPQRRRALRRDGLLPLPGRQRAHEQEEEEDEEQKQQQQQEQQEKRCSHCGTGSTVVWRRHPGTGEQLCNRCRQYMYNHAGRLPDGEQKEAPPQRQSQRQAPRATAALAGSAPSAAGQQSGRKRGRQPKQEGQPLAVQQQTARRTAGRSAKRHRAHGQPLVSAQPAPLASAVPAESLRAAQQPAAPAAGIVSLLLAAADQAAAAASGLTPSLAAVFASLLPLQSQQVRPGGRGVASLVACSCSPTAPAALQEDYLVRLLQRRQYSQAAALMEASLHLAGLAGLAAPARQLG